MIKPAAPMDTIVWMALKDGLYGSAQKLSGRRAYASSPFPLPSVCWRTVGQQQSTDD
jgi:hypothetical protein